MAGNGIHMITGAYGFTGRYLGELLLQRGKRVATLTNSPNRPHPFGDRVKPFPLDFNHPDHLARNLEGVDCLYNSYWVRFNHTTFTHSEAVGNTLKLFEAAVQAGVKRIVHISITNPSLDSRLEYFHGKAELEEALKKTGIPHSILRPAVLFGSEDILINNIAWMLRTFPLFGLFGWGEYRLQPIFVGDLAELMADHGERGENFVVDAIGPESFTYRELVTLIGKTIGCERVLFPMPPFIGLWISRLIGWYLRDYPVTAEEIEGLMADLLYTPSPPAGKTRLSEWVATNREVIGTRYANELARRRDRSVEYGRE